MKASRLIAVAALLAGTSLSAHAAPTTFFGEDLNANGGATPNSDAARASFFSNLTGVATENFDSIAAGTSNPVLTFTGCCTATLVGGGQINNFSNAGRFAISSPNYYETFAGSAGMTFSSPIAAFGFYATDIGDYGGQLTLTLTDTLANVTVLNVGNTVGSGGNTSGTALYFGFFDLTAQYTSIACGNSSCIDGFGYDNLSVGSIQQVTPGGRVPEPITLSLFGAGLVGAAVMRRRRKA